MLALDLCLPEIARLLIEKNPDLKAQNSDGWSALHFALYRRQADIALRLVEKGAPVNAPDRDGWTPLAVALRYGMPDVGRVLVEKGADINARDEEGWTPLMFAVRYDEPGQWSPGPYHVDFFVGPAKVARAGFEIY